MKHRSNHYLSFISICLIIISPSLVYAKSLQSRSKDEMKETKYTRNLPDYEIKVPGTFYGFTALQEISRENLNSIGPTYISDSIITDTAQVIGPLEIKDTIVGKVEITGPLDADNLQSNNIKAIGATDLNNTLVKNKLEIIGSLDIVNSEIHTIEVVSSHINLDNAKIFDLHIKHNNNDNSEFQYVYIRGETHIDKIYFEDRNGIVLYEPGNNFRIAKIIGGRLKPLTNF